MLSEELRESSQSSITAFGEEFRSPTDSKIPLLRFALCVIAERERRGRVKESGREQGKEEEEEREGGRERERERERADGTLG